MDNFINFRDIYKFINKWIQLKWIRRKSVKHILILMLRVRFSECMIHYIGRNYTNWWQHSMSDGFNTDFFLRFWTISVFHVVKPSALNFPCVIPAKWNGESKSWFILCSILSNLYSRHRMLFVPRPFANSSKVLSRSFS